MTQVSIRDVAKVAGVSIASVSRCVNDPARVLQTCYPPNALAQSFRRGKTHVIMVVLPSVGVPFIADVMKGIRSVAAGKVTAC